MIKKVNNDFYIEKNQNRFYIKDLDDNVLMICNNYLDAIVELENFYNITNKNNNLNFQTEIFKPKKEVSDLKFDKIADFINLKINNLEHNLQTQIAQITNQTNDETFDLQFNDKWLKAKEANLVKKEPEEDWEQENELPTNEYNGVFDKILEINNSNSLSFKSFEKTIKTLIDQLNEKIENNEKRYNEIMFENLVSDSKINDLDNSLKSVILNLNQIKDNCLEKSFENKLNEREDAIIDNFQINLNNQITIFKAELSTINAEIENLKNNQKQMLNKNDINEIINKNNYQLDELLNSLKNEIMENKTAINFLNKTSANLVSNESLKEVENKMSNEFQEFKLAQENYLEFKANDLKEKMTVITKEIENFSLATNNHVSLDKVNNIKVEMFKAFQDELKLVKTNYEDKLQKSEKKFKTSFETLKKEFVESLDLLLTLNNKMKDLVNQEELNSIKKKWILEVNKKMISAN